MRFAYEPFAHQNLASLLEEIRRTFPDGPLVFVAIENWDRVEVAEGTAVVYVAGDETLRKCRKTLLPKWWAAVRPGGYHVYHDVMCHDNPTCSWSLPKDTSHRRLFTGHFLPADHPAWLIREHDGEPATFYFRKGG